MRDERLDLIEELERETNDVVDFFDVYKEALKRGLIQDIDIDEADTDTPVMLDDFMTQVQADELAETNLV